MLSLTFDPREIGFNPFKDDLRLLLAEARDNPFARVMVILGVIASYIIRDNALSRMAHRDHITGDCAGVIRARVSNSYPMIYCDYVPEVRQTTTDSASTFKVLTSRDFLLRRKRRWQSALMGAATVFNLSNLIGVSLLIVTHSFFYFAGIGFIPFASLFFYLARIILVILTFSLAYFVEISLVIAVMLFSYLIGMRFAILAMLFVYFTGINFIPLMLLSFSASLARRAQSVHLAYIFMEKLDCCRKPLMALYTTLERKGDIQHHNLLQLHPIEVLGAELGNSDVRRVIKSSQAHAYYTINRGAIWL